MNKINFNIEAMPYQTALETLKKKNTKGWENLIIDKTIYVFLGGKMNLCECSEKITKFHQWSYNVALDAILTCRPGLYKKRIFRPHIVGFLFIYMAFLEQEARLLFEKYSKDYKTKNDPKIIKKINKEASTTGTKIANDLINSLFETYSISKCMEAFYEDLIYHLERDVTGAKLTEIKGVLEALKKENAKR